MNKIDNDKFIFLYQGANGNLNDSQKEGMYFLLNALQTDEHLNDIRWISYMLATTRHECGGKWQPIEEYDKGEGKKYGIPDAETHLAYYGRGFVQLTWKENYETMSKIVEQDLVHHPELVCTPEIAYKIMSYGMRNGSFTGVGLKKFINDTKCDYVNARKIINGLDCAEKIASYANQFENILKQCEIKDA